MLLLCFHVNWWCVVEVVVIAAALVLNTTLVVVVRVLHVVVESKSLFHHLKPDSVLPRMRCSFIFNRTG